MSVTAIPPARLVELRVEARLATSRFQNPVSIRHAVRAIRTRGEGWAADVCGHPFNRRSIAFPDLPWLSTGEAELLALADTEEDRVRFDGIVQS